MELLDLAKKIELVQTCNACPEQYDAFIDGKQVGYLRVRWGYFSVRYPNAAGEEIYGTDIKGDGLFDWDEREGQLAAARLRIINKVYEEGL